MTITWIVVKIRRGSHLIHTKTSFDAKYFYDFDIQKKVDLLEKLLTWKILNFVNKLRPLMPGQRKTFCQEHQSQIFVALKNKLFLFCTLCGCFTGSYFGYFCVKLKKGAPTFYLMGFVLECSKEVSAPWSFYRTQGFKSKGTQKVF